MKLERAAAYLCRTPWAMAQIAYDEFAMQLANEDFAPGVVLHADADYETMNGAREKYLRRLHAFAADSATAMSARPGSRGLPTVGDVGIVGLFGVIAPKMDIVTYYFGGTSLADFEQDLASLASDDHVKRIFLLVDSPGGSVYGVEEAAKRVKELSAKKSVTAAASHVMASAAYHIGSQADRIAVSPSGDVGSIGVYARHMDISRMTDEAGITYTEIIAGRNKAEYSPYRPLSDEGRARLQEEVDTYYSKFVADVAAGRKTTPATVRGPEWGQGRSLLAKEALAAGMVDRIAPAGDVLAGMLAPTATRSRNRAELLTRIHELELGAMS